MTSTKVNASDEELPRWLQEHIDVGLILVGPGTRVVLWNRWLEDRSGIAAGDALGQPLLELFPELRGGRLADAVHAALEDHQPSVLSNSLNRAPLPLWPPSASTATALDRIQQSIRVDPVRRLDNGAGPHCLIQILDVTMAVRRERGLLQQVRQRKEAQAVLDQERRMFMSGPSVVIKRAAEGGLPVEYASGNLTDQTGYLPEELYDSRRPYLDLIHPQDLEKTVRAIRTGCRSGNDNFTMEYRLRTADGTYRWFIDATSVIRDNRGHPSQINGYIEDITERKNAEAEIERLAFHDALTGLLNRNHVLERVTEHMAMTRRRGGASAGFFIDLDRFKQINDSFGHDAGDTVLEEVGRRIRASLRKDDIAARLGGDEFFVMTHIGPTSAEQTERATYLVAKKLRKVICRPVRFKEREIPVACSIGVSLYDADESGPEAVLRQADIAMYTAKRADPEGGISFYRPDMLRRVEERMALERDLARAIEEGDFRVVYQPLVKPDGTIAGFEALLRWVRGGFGNVSPRVFIPLAEETGLIHALGRHSIGMALAALRRWERDRAYAGFLSVNISPTQFQDDGFSEWLVAATEEASLSPGKIILELTEGAILHNIEEAATRMRYLKEVGFRLALDDFGTGYSSLSHLTQLPVDIVKLDRSFLLGLEGTPTRRRLVEGVMRLARDLDLYVVAEGVETAGQLDFLREGGCDAVQGFYLHRPMSEDDTQSLMAPAIS